MLKKLTSANLRNLEKRVGDYFAMAQIKARSLLVMEMYLSFAFVDMMAL